MNVSNAGLAFLLDWEGFRAYLYDDGGKRGLGNATVGIGILVHLGPYHDRGQCAACDKWPRNTEPKATWLTPEQGMLLLNDKANATGVFAGGQNYVGAVRKAFPTVNQNQFDAMVSYSYNYGSGAVGRMATAFYAGKDMFAAFTDPRYLLPAWAHDGLLRRRKAEYGLWSKPDDGSATFPEEDLVNRINGTADFFTGQMFNPGNYLLNIDTDFPGVPANARAVRLEIILRQPGGGVVVQDASKAHAGQIRAGDVYLQVDALIGPIMEPPLNGARGIRWAVTVGAVTIDTIGILGWF